VGVGERRSGGLLSRVRRARRGSTDGGATRHYADGRAARYGELDWQKAHAPGELGMLGCRREMRYPGAEHPRLFVTELDKVDAPLAPILEYFMETFWHRQSNFRPIPETLVAYLVPHGNDCCVP
jgi:hypothetical protein